jgi:hypothetical protein
MKFRLNPGTREAKQFMLQEMEEFFLGKVAPLPPDYVPPQHGTAFRLSPDAWAAPRGHRTWLPPV